MIGSKAIAISRVTLLEAVRRRDLYVMLILSGVVIVMAGVFNFFGVPELNKFMIDVSLSIINIFTIIIAVIVSARQLPYELEHRTLYPMLAKPVGRFHFLMGKFMGIMWMSTVAVVTFSVVCVGVFIAFKVPLSAVLVQYIFLRWVSLFLICSMTLCLSLLLTHAANVTISLLVCMGAAMFTRTVIIVHDALGPWQQKLITAAYWLFPHLDLFDISKRVVHGWPAVPAWALVYVTMYALIYTGIFLGLGYLLFRRKPL